MRNKQKVPTWLEHSDKAEQDSVVETGRDELIWGLGMVRSLYFTVSAIENYGSEDSDSGMT